MGVESGNQHLLDAAKKGIDLGQIKKVFKWAKQLKINTHAHLIIGISGESPQTIKASQRFIRQIDPTIVTYGVLIPYQGTELYQNLADNNVQANTAINNNLSEVLLSEHLQKNVRMCYLDFYLRPRYLFRRLFDCRSFAEFKIILFAAKNVIGFIFGKES
ncbi:MAG: hypothetical protein KKD05_11085 [Candidatus Omnitrophica bacterium]|nr:hypothetical protein [Candidatus Omnitrophota bacterium]